MDKIFRQVQAQGNTNSSDYNSVPHFDSRSRETRNRTVTQSSASRSRETGTYHSVVTASEITAKSSKTKSGGSHIPSHAHSPSAAQGHRDGDGDGHGDGGIESDRSYAYAYPCPSEQGEYTDKEYDMANNNSASGRERLN